jgi:predicted dehydrogenase
MKVLVIGLGSMGKRRLRCLKRLGIADITGFDPRADRREEASSKYGIAATGDWDRARTLASDAWIVSTPPDTHVGYGTEAVTRGISFFTEANVTDPSMRELIAALAKSDIVGAPSCTMRYYFGPRRIKAMVEAGAIGRPLTFTYQSGQYLPDWHPWESYKDFYVSKRATGACREIVPFELCWLTDVFGPVASLSCMKDRLGDLDADIDDVYQLLLRFDNRVIGHLMVDVIARPAVRLFRLLGTSGTIEWDHGLKRLRHYGAENGSWKEESLDIGTVEPGYLHAEEPYVDEMADFLAAVRRERPWPYPFTEDERILSLLERAESSDRHGRHY